jgi:branched-chain amino acid aminotransferase
VMIATWDWPSYFDPEQKKKGIRLTYAKYRRPDPRSAPVHAKATGLYMICTLSKHEAERAGYADALFLDCYDNIAEATGANIFLIKDGVIHTPTPESFLNGITRQSVIKLARQRGFEVVERTIPFSELGSFSEVFITGSAAEVTPVSEIGEFRFTPGNISLSLMDDYAKMVRRQLQPIEA